MRNPSGDLDEVLLPMSATYLGIGVILWLVGYGLTPLVVTGGTILVLRKVFRSIEQSGSPLGKDD